MFTNLCIIGNYSIFIQSGGAMMGKAKICSKNKIPQNLIIRLIEFDNWQIEKYGHLCYKVEKKNKEYFINCITRSGLDLGKSKLCCATAEQTISFIEKMIR